MSVNDMLNCIMKKIALIVVIVGCSLSLLAQKTIRIGPYEVVYKGTIIDTVLVKSPAAYYNLRSDTIIFTVRDTIFREKEVFAKLTPTIPLKNAFEIGIFTSPVWIKNKRLHKDFWNTRAGFSFGADVAYKRKFGRIFGMGIGVSFSMSRQSISVDNSESIENLIDMDNNKYTGNFTYNDINERNTLSMIGIPISIGFDNVSLNRVGFYSSFTFIPAFVVKNKFEVYGSYQSSGFYPEWNVNIHDVAELGFYKEKAIDPQEYENISKASACLSGKISLGISVPLSRFEDYDYNHSLFKIGCFFEYGKVIVRKSEIATPEFNYYIGENNLMYGKSVSMMAVGLELAFTIGK